MDILPFFWWLLLSLSSRVNGQAKLNSLAATYPNLQTMSVNGTWFIALVDIAAATAMVQPSYNLLTISADDPYFPGVSQQGKHPIMITPGSYDNDIRMGDLRVDHLLQGGITVLYVDGTKDGKSPCQYAYRTFDGGLPPSKLATPLAVPQYYLHILNYSSSIQLRLWFERDLRLL